MQNLIDTQNEPDSRNLAIDRVDELVLLGAGRGIQNGVESNFNDDIATVKYSAADGARQWLTVYGNPGVGFFDVPHDLAVDQPDRPAGQGRHRPHGQEPARSVVESLTGQRQRHRSRRPFHAPIPDKAFRSLGEP